MKKNLIKKKLEELRGERERVVKVMKPLLQPLERIPEETKNKGLIDFYKGAIIDEINKANSYKKVFKEVEPLQNGERDWKQMKKEIEELRDKNPDEIQDSRYGFRMRIGDIITTHADFNTLISDFEDMLSQSKKEYIEKIESWLDSKGTGTIFTYDQLKKKLESLTNQKKEDEK